MEIFWRVGCLDEPAVKRTPPHDWRIRRRSREAESRAVCAHREKAWRVSGNRKFFTFKIEMLPFALNGFGHA